MTVSTAELPPVLIKYFDLAANGDIVFTTDGIEVARLVTSKPKRSVVDEILGVIPDDGLSIEDARKARCGRI